MGKSKSKTKNVDTGRLANIEVGRYYDLEIEDMSYEGNGIGRIEGITAFIYGAIIGDKVRAEIHKIKKNFVIGSTIEILEPSRWRIESKCKYIEECGGCSYGNISYEAQLELKEKQLRDKLIRIAGVDEPRVQSIIPAENPYNYRNKAQMHVSTDGIVTKKGGIVEAVSEPKIGFFRAKSHEVVDCEVCLIQEKPVEAVARAVRQFMKEDHITAYDEKWGKGLFRYVVVKTAINTGEVMVILVVNGKGIPNGEKLIGMIDDEINMLPKAANGIEYSLESVILNVNKDKGSTVMGKECITLAGKPTILEKMGDLQFEISPLAFYQVNPRQTVKLYEKVLEYAELKGGEKILDIYCGVGTIGLYCAKQMGASGKGQVTGIESVKGAVVDANRNAVINGIVNARFICAKAEEVLENVLMGEDEKFNPDIIILDPPRNGCDCELLKIAAASSPQKIIYVSCEPATFARDARILSENGYNIVEVTPVDMFPWTSKCELVCLLKKERK